MGYTTTFEGSFVLDRPLSAEHAAELRERHRKDDWAEGHPRLGYCQWIPTDDGKGIAWDQGEKFYRWAAWLQFLIDEYLTPWGYRLTGSVEWDGEEALDVGVLSVREGKVVKDEKPLKPLSDMTPNVRARLADAIRNNLYDVRGMRREEAREACRAILATLGEDVRGRGFDE
jgi:hypothetical protein